MGIFHQGYKIDGGRLLRCMVCRDIYYAEQQILKALPKMIDKATNREVCSVHGPQESSRRDQRKTGRTASKKVFPREARQAAQRDARCPAIDGIIKRKRTRPLARSRTRRILDAAIVANAQSRRALSTKCAAMSFLGP